MKFSELRRIAVIEFINDKKLNDKIVDIGKGIYLSYPDFFFRLIFGEKVNFKDQKQTQFCIASYLMYKFLIEIDDYIDEENISLFNSASISKLIEKQNLSQRLLANLFEFNSDFWEIYDSRQIIFIECVKFELTKINQTFKIQHYSSPIEISFYHSYYAKKCIFSALAIDGLYIMNEKKCGLDTYQLALKINNLFNVAFCILDDVEDYRKDISKKQINFAHHYYISKFCKEVKDIDYELNNSIELFFTKGISIEVMEIAKNELETALYEIKSNSVNEDLELLIELKLTDLKNKMNIIKEYAN